MDQSTIPWVLTAVLAAAALSQWARAAWLSRRPSWRARGRARRAGRGERAAERLLRRHGYRILARQPRAGWDITVDGHPRHIELRPDLLVEARGGGARVAEIKTGRLAPRLDHPATRRQLLEYALAFGVRGVLLVDAETERVHEVTFSVPGARRTAGDRWAWLLAGVTLGAVACWAYLRLG